MDFWSSVILRSGRSKGNPFGAHKPFADGIGPAHFERWLALWGTTARSCLEAAAAMVLEERAARIADSLKAGLFFGPDADLASGTDA